MIALLKLWWENKLQRFRCAMGNHTRAVGTASLIDYEIFERLRMDSKWVCEFCHRELLQTHPLVVEARARIAAEMAKLGNRAGVQSRPLDLTDRPG
jgi:hypothetical protein